MEVLISMVRNEFTFPSADGKTSIHAVEWLPDDEIKAVLQITHGVSEFILRYEPFAAFLTERGFAVVGHDHIGHGESVAPNAARLYFGPKGSWDWVIQDIHTLRNLAAQRFPGIPYFLLGHSMGSFAARTYLIRHPGTVDGAVIMGTGQMAPALLMGGKLYATLSAAIHGEDFSDPMVDKLSFGTYNKIFAPNRTAFDWLSVNQENVDWYIDHPLCGGNPTLGLFREMLSGMQFIAKPSNLRNMDLSTPILFISGEMDPVGDCGKGVLLASRSFEAAGVLDVSVKLYPNLRHEILNETCRETVYDDVCQWLLSHIPTEKADTSA